MGAIWYNGRDKDAERDWLVHAETPSSNPGTGENGNEKTTTNPGLGRYLRWRF